MADVWDPVKMSGLWWLHATGPTGILPPLYFHVLFQHSLNAIFLLSFCKSKLKRKETAYQHGGSQPTPHRSSHLQPRPPCSALLLHEEAQLVAHLWLVELLPAPHHLSLREATQKHRRSLLLSTPKLTCEWGGNFSQLKSSLIPSEFKSQWQATTIAATSKQKVGRL